MHIIIAADSAFNAGERRLRACQHLGHTTIDVRRWPDLTEEERREIELAENLDRKDLMPAERSRQMVALAEVAAETLRDEFLPDSGRKAGAGRPPKPDAETKVAERIGVPQQTLNDAKRHVAAIDAYPELAIHTQADALKIAGKLNEMPEEERVEVRAKVAAHDGPTLARLTDRPPLPNGATPHQRAATDPWGSRPRYPDSGKARR